MRRLPFSYDMGEVKIRKRLMTNDYNSEKLK